MSSRGLSIKDILHGNEAASNTSILKNTPTPENECFYNLCTKEKRGCCSCGTFKNKNHKLFCCCFSTMMVSLLLGIILPLILYKFVDDSIQAEVVIDSTSAKNYDVWKTNAEGKGFDDYKVHFDLWYFDIQNVDDILKGAKPIVVEVGPYAYNEYFNKFNIEWSDHGDTVTFYNYKYYIFDQSRTGPGLTEQDMLTLPYPTVSGFQHILESVPVSDQMKVEYAINMVLQMSYNKIQFQLWNITDNLEESRTRANSNIIDNLEDQIVQINSSVNQLYSQMFAFTAQSDPLDLFFKNMMCGTENGITPFYQANPSIAWFGMLTDPLLVQVEQFLYKIPGLDVAKIWTNTIPGITTNYSSMADMERRMMPSTFKTGKKNGRQVGQYVKYNNQKSFWNCILPMESNQSSLYQPGVNAPACAHWDESWTDEQAVEHGYVKPWMTDYANRIEGTDGNLYGRPVDTERIQIFSYDIYRGGFMLYKKDVYDWYDVKLRRYGIQAKDMWNSTLNPANAQYFANGISGVENLTQAMNLPVYVSFPHFLYGDPRLVEAVTGLHPVEAYHNSEIDLEPQTGMVARATKRIQVSYLMKTTIFPTAQNDTLESANIICAQIQNLIEQAGQLDLNTTLPTIDCNLTMATQLLECMVRPSDWIVNDHEVYFPYGWVQESIVMPESSADEIKDNLYFADDLAASIRFWCMIIAGICFGVQLTMVCTQYNRYKAATAEQRKAERYGLPVGESQNAAPLINPSAPQM